MFQLNPNWPIDKLTYKLFDEAAQLRDGELLALLLSVVLRLPVVVPGSDNLGVNSIELLKICLKIFLRF